MTKALIYGVCLAVITMISVPIAQADLEESKKMPTASMREQVLHLQGDPERPVTLEATLFEPPG